MQVRVRPGSLHGTLQVPGSKSHTIRCVLLSLLAKGPSVIHNPLASGDGLSALAVSKAFGATVQQQKGRWVIEGRGSQLLVPENCIDTRNSGTTTCFFTSVAALVDGYTVITGDQQIRRRPILPLVNALNELGAKAFLTRPNQSAPPVVVRGVMKGGNTTINGFNSQYVSSLLLSTPLVQSTTHLTVVDALEKPYVQMTLDWMHRYGVDVANDHAYGAFTIEGGQSYKSGEHHIPADWSAVAFPLVASVITDSDLVLTGLDFQDSQGDKRVVDILISMGADIVKDTEAGTLHCRGGVALQGGQVIDLSDIPDALPALVVAATQAHGSTVFTNLQHVRVKETDRVGEMTQKLNLLGCDLSIVEDSLVVRGPTAIGAGTVSSSHDHRIAMALVSAAMAAQEEVVVTDAECADVSFPGFFDSFRACGANLEVMEDAEL